MLSRLLTIFSIVLLLFFNLEYWHFSWLGWLVLPIYFWFISDGFEKALIKFFNFSPNARTKLYGAFFGFILLGWLCGALIVFYKLTPVLISTAMVIVGLISQILDNWATKAKNTEISETVQEEIIEIPQSKIYLWAYFIFFIFGLVLLWQCRTGREIETPWQVVPVNFIYLFFLAALTLGGLFFSKLKTKTLLFLIVLQTFMMAAYLPMSHKLFYGADGWRHIASMERIIAEVPLSAQNYAMDSSWISRLDPGLFSYSQFWGSLSTLSRLLNVGLIPLTAWFQPLLFSLLIPLLLYEIGVSLGWGKRKPLLFAWFGLWPFAFQAASSFSLPVNYGFIIFLFLLLLLLKRGEGKRHEQVFMLLALGVFSFFGYALYFIIFWVSWFLFEFLNRRKCEKPALRGKIIYAAIIFSAVVFIPVIELTAGYAKFSAVSNIASSSAQAIGNFSGYYLANGPRPHIIERGNVFFNQTPSYLFFPNALTAWRWWIPAFMIMIFCAMIFGLIKFFRSTIANEKWLAILGVGIYGGYIISRYFFSGDNILSRRLDVVLAFFGIIFLFKAVEKVFDKNQFASLLILIVGSVAIASSYSLGPVSRAMSVAEYETAGKVWSEIKQDDKYCVVADTYQLLALEAVSAKKVIGGGFPIDKNFGQSELVSLYKDFINTPSEALWQKTAQLTGADKCYLIINNNIESKNF